MEARTFLDPLMVLLRRTIVNFSALPNNNSSFEFIVRSKGHLVANLDPLKMTKNPDSDTAQVMEALKHVPTDLALYYCGNIGYEVSHLEETEKTWFREKIEKKESFDKLHIAKILLKSQTFDRFMSKRFAQVKRYSLEGNESMMVALDEILHKSTKDIVMCMPHRGRLNVLVNLLKYPFENLFAKIRGGCELPQESRVTGDVLSHLFKKQNIGKIDVMLLPNPSHLEAVNPVALGYARSNDSLSIQMHGDAAFCGQGVVMESLALSNLSGYTVGGSIHIIVNNQLGFTATHKELRSTFYATDIGKFVRAPIIHVNSDFPEDVLKASRIVLQYQQQFHKDVILDIIGYRRYGHNELDEPSFTQPMMYKTIRNKMSCPDRYALENKVDKQLICDYQSEIDAATKKQPQFLMCNFQQEKHTIQKIDRITIQRILKASVTLPPNFVTISNCRHPILDFQSTL